MNPDGSLDEAAYRTLCKEKGIEFPYLPSNMSPPLEMPSVFTLPVIKRVNPGLVASDIVSVQPMTETKDCQWHRIVGETVGEECAIEDMKPGEKYAMCWSKTETNAEEEY
jgi:hypothetical protein